MSGAGYGNHTPMDEADAKPDPSGQKPAAGGGDRPGSDTGAQSAGVDDRASPAGEHRGGSTPGSGALPDGPQGDEVDPGAG